VHGIRMVAALFKKGRKGVVFIVREINKGDGVGERIEGIERDEFRIRRISRTDLCVIIVKIESFFRELVEIGSDLFAVYFLKSTAFSSDSN